MFKPTVCVCVCVCVCVFPSNDHIDWLSITKFLILTVYSMWRQDGNTDSKKLVVTTRSSSGKHFLWLLPKHITGLIPWVVDTVTGSTTNGNVCQCTKSVVGINSYTSAFYALIFFCAIALSDECKSENICYAITHVLEWTACISYSQVSINLFLINRNAN